MVWPWEQSGPTSPFALCSLTALTYLVGSQVVDIVFMLVVLKADMPILLDLLMLSDFMESPGLPILSLFIESPDLLMLSFFMESPDIAIELFSIMPLTFNLCPTSGFKSLEDISMTPSGCSLLVIMKCPSFSLMHPVMDIAFPFFMLSAFICELSDDC